MDWLNKYKAPCVRVNSDDFHVFYDIDLSAKETTDIHWFWKWETPDFDKNEQLQFIFNKRFFIESQRYKKLFKFYFSILWYVSKIGCTTNFPFSRNPLQSTNCLPLKM